MQLARQYLLPVPVLHLKRILKKRENTFAIPIESMQIAQHAFYRDILSLSVQNERDKISLQQKDECHITARISSVTLWDVDIHLLREKKVWPN